jgi:pyruvate dehydrogenase E2 component (dihydrolipoamide acetyltransferase)
MISKVLMPKLGLVMKKGRIIKWYKQAGDFVKEGEPLFQISTEKVTIDVEAKASGYLRIIYAQAGAVVPVSGIVGLMGDKGEPLPDIKPPAYEIDKKGMDVTTVQNNVQHDKDIKASPAAKRLAKEKGIDLARVKGTGPGGRITESDITNFKPEKAKNSIAEAAQTPSTPYAKRLAQEHGIAMQQVAQSTGDRKIYAQDVINMYQSSAAPATEGGNEQSTLLPLTDLRSAVADRMSYSARTVAPVTLGMEAIADEIIKLKNALSLDYPSDKITINDILVKLVAMAVKKHPLANASLEENGIRIYHVVNMGIGVAIEGGLIVPAIANADRKSIVQISRESKDLIERAKTGRLTFKELSRGTFTLTNLGAYGIDMFTPIINPPQSATLGIGRIVRKPWVMDDKIEIVSTMVLSLTFDHRIIDGAPAAQCLLTIKQYIENPGIVLVSPSPSSSPLRGEDGKG